MSTSTIKLLIAAILFFTWIGLVFAKSYDPLLDTSTLIPAIQAALAGLGVYHTMDTPADPPSNSQSAAQPTDKAAS